MTDPNLENIPYVLFSHSLRYDELGPNMICVCGKSLEYNDIQLDGYVTHPMIWCESCGGRYFLDCVTIELEDFDVRMHEKVGVAKDFFDNVKKSDKNDPVYKIPVCFINKISGSNMMHFRSKNKLGSSVVKKLGSNNLFELCENRSKIDIDKIRELMHKYNVTIYIYHTNKEDIDYMKSQNIPYEVYDCDYDYDTVFDGHLLMVECDSYNVTEPKYPYPDFVDTAHDGVTVTCDIIHQGSVITVKYWGD